MSEQYLTDEQFENLIFSLVVSILELPADTENVRLSWPEEGQPAWEITEDIVFIRCQEIDDNYNRPREHEDTYNSGDDEFDREIAYTRVMQVEIIIYGPSSFAYAQALRDGVFEEVNRITLAQNKVYLIPDNPSPRRNPELFQGRWWKRYDINFKFNMLTVKEKVMPAIEQVGIALYEGDQGNKIKDVSIEE